MPSKKRTRKSRKQANSKSGRANIVVNVNSHNKRKSTVVKKDGGGGGNPLIMPIPFPQYLPQQQPVQHHLSQPTRLPFLADQNIQNARTMHDSVREQELREAQIQNRILQSEKQQLMQRMKPLSKAMPPEDNPFELNSMRGNVHQDSVLDKEAFLPVGKMPSYTKSYQPSGTFHSDTETDMPVRPVRRSYGRQKRDNETDEQHQKRINTLDKAKERRRDRKDNT